MKGKTSSKSKSKHKDHLFVAVQRAAQEVARKGYTEPDPGEQRDPESKHPKRLACFFYTDKPTITPAKKAKICGKGNPPRLIRTDPRISASGAYWYYRGAFCNSAHDVYHGVLPCGQVCVDLRMFKSKQSKRYLRKLEWVFAAYVLLYDDLKLFKQVNRREQWNYLLTLNKSIFKRALRYDAQVLGDHGTYHDLVKTYAQLTRCKDGSIYWVPCR